MWVMNSVPAHKILRKMKKGKMRLRYRHSKQATQCSFIDTIFSCIDPQVGRWKRVNWIGFPPAESERPGACLAHSRRNPNIVHVHLEIDNLSRRTTLPVEVSLHSERKFRVRTMVCEWTVVLPFTNGMNKPLVLTRCNHRNAQCQQNT